MRLFLTLTQGLPHVSILKDMANCEKSYLNWFGLLIVPVKDRPHDERDEPQNRNDHQRGGEIGIEIHFLDFQLRDPADG